MKVSLLVLGALVAVVSSQPPTPIPVLSRTEVHDDSGQFSLTFQTGNGITQQERGVLKRNKEGDGNVLVKDGSVSYTAPDGTPIRLDYVADENGFRATGAHLPVPVQPLA